MVLTSLKAASITVRQYIKACFHGTFMEKRIEKLVSSLNDSLQSIGHMQLNILDYLDYNKIVSS
jgi:hypothetical protein